MTLIKEPIGSAARPIAIFLYEPGSGGLDRVAILLANGFAERGLVTELWLSKTSGPLLTLISPKVIVRHVPTAGFNSRALNLFLQLPALIRMVRRFKPAVLMSAGNQSNLTTAIAARLAGGDTRAVQKITNPICRPGMSAMQRAFRIWRTGINQRLSAQTMVLSPADAEELARLHPRTRDRLRFVHNPYVTPAMLEAGRARAAPNHADDVPLLISVGRLSPQKDHATMLRALGKLRALRWKLAILGEGPLASGLAQQVASLGLADRVEFVGFVADPLPWFEKARLVIVSSRWEGLPAVPIEAMACGCNVVSTDCSPGLRALLAAADLPRPTALGDSDALADAIAAALQSPHCCQTMNRFSERYSLDSSVDNHLEALHAMDAAGNGGPEQR